MKILEILAAGAIRAYQWFIRPILPMSCRFYPSCSHYALEAVRRHGAVNGGRLAVWRLLRCHPWGGSGLDPVPVNPKMASRAPDPDTGGSARPGHGQI